ncbi:SGNH/GDSL hydrolase family protein [Candidatus Margulisiibacteriota bacterium]
MLLAVLVLELVLKIHNPFDPRIKGDKIILPVNRTYNIEDVHTKEKILHKKNSLGFRGPEPTKNMKEKLTIIAVGGSTTECFYLDDTKTWPFLLGNKLQKRFQGLWLNNAGLDGHSSFGHLVLMEDYIVKLKPKVVYFLVGINDMGIQELRTYDLANVKAGMNFSSPKRLFKSLAQHSEIMAIALNIVRYFKAKAMKLEYGIIDLDEVRSDKVSTAEKKLALQENRQKFLAPYQVRLIKLVNICKENGITPILITQPALWGNQIITTKNGKPMVIDLKNTRYAQDWAILELYNNVTRKVGQQENILVIDLAKKMPKKLEYYSDPFHFVPKGSKIVANIIAVSSYPYLRSRFPEYRIK